MIFVTVGTHEQQFNRLVEYMDKWALENNEEVIIQIGFSDYIPKHAHYRKFFSYEEMVQNMKKAKIIITHGGPSSFISVIQLGKIPIVVPRQKKYNEHVNNHQLEFGQYLENRKFNLILVEEIQELNEKIKNYDYLTENLNSEKFNNNQAFCEKFEKIIDKVLK